MARIAFNDCLTASGIVAAWHARPELLRGTVFPITNPPSSSCSGFMSTQFQPVPLQKRRVKLELSKPAPQTVVNNR